MDDYVEENKIYDVKKQLLTFQKKHTLAKENNSKNKIINKFLPTSFKKEMSAFVDPNKISSNSSLYDLLFETN